MPCAALCCPVRVNDAPGVARRAGEVVVSGARGHACVCVNVHLRLCCGAHYGVLSRQAALRGQAEFRVERQGIVMAGLGKLSFTDEQLKENLRAFMIALSNAKPEAVKGQYFRVRGRRSVSPLCRYGGLAVPYPVCGPG